MKKKNLLLVFSIILLASCTEKRYEKSATFPQNATLEEKLKIASHIVPSPQQLAWQELETTVFFHFGINTFTGREWGDGTESPTLFNPTNLNITFQNSPLSFFLNDLSLSYIYKKIYNKISKIEPLIFLY